MKNHRASSSLAMCQRRQCRCYGFSGGMAPKKQHQAGQAGHRPEKCDCQKAARADVAETKTLGLAAEGNSPQPNR